MQLNLNTSTMLERNYIIRISARARDRAIANQTILLSQVQVTVTSEVTVT